MKHDRQKFESQLEAFLDGLLDETERTKFLSEYQGTELEEIIAREQQLNSSLKRLFPTTHAPASAIERIESGLSPSQSPVATGQPFSLTTAVIALAASLAFVALSTVWWYHRDAGSPTPYFQPVALCDIYQETIKNGFEPYYECEDDQRFADVFRVRQGIALQLKPFPEGTRMLGLSYPGGLSRETTAMLCIADGQPAMVFVDRRSSDHPDVARSTDPEIFVHRIQKYDLVFYEVSPFDAPRLIEYMIKAESPK